MSNLRHNSRDIFPPTGPELNAKSWMTEAPLRMLMNNRDPDVAENLDTDKFVISSLRRLRAWERTFKRMSDR